MVPKGVPSMSKNNKKGDNGIDRDGCEMMGKHAEDDGIARKTCEDRAEPRQGGHAARSEKV